MTKYNLILDYKDITEDSSVTEPVSLQEAKDWMRVEGFIDDEDSSGAFDDDDDFIEMLIVSARKRIEQWTGLSLIPKIWEVELTNLAGYISLPFPPIVQINSLISADDEDETEIDYTTTSNNRKLKTPLQENLIVTYEAGYSETPDWAKNAILTEVAYRYTNRGDESEYGLCKDCLVICSPYKEVDTWL